MLGAIIDPIMLDASVEKISQAHGASLCQCVAAFEFKLCARVVGEAHQPETGLNQLRECFIICEIDPRFLDQFANLNYRTMNTPPRALFSLLECCTSCSRLS